MSDFVLPEKLPKLRTPEDFAMTKEDWQEYFECRKKYDKKHSLTEDLNIGYKSIELKKRGVSDKEINQFNIDSCLMIDPDVALKSKFVLGLKRLQEFNLFAAKEKYPDEF